jgi:hypothetical protein
MLTWLVLDLTKLICLGWLLCGEETKPLLDGDPLPAVLVLRGEHGGVRGEGGLALRVHLAEGVHPGFVTVEVVHQIHDGFFGIYLVRHFQQLHGLLQVYHFLLHPWCLLHVLIHKFESLADSLLHFSSYMPHWQSRK